jgi:hypothetical protein
MSILTRIDKHTDLFQRMADTVGVDLGEAVFRGQLPPQGLRAAVMSCMGCEGAMDCPGWLDDHAEGSDQTPAYCRNSRLLAQLKTA